MAKVKNQKALTTEQALEQLLGRKAAKRIRDLAERLASEGTSDDDGNGDDEIEPKNKKKEKKSKKKR